MQATVYEASFQALELAVGDYVTVDVLGAMPNQQIDAGGALVDTLEILWQYVDHPGTFTTSVPFVDDWLTFAIGWVLRDAEIVAAIYRGDPDSAGWSDLAGPQPGSPLPTTIPQPGTTTPV